MLWPTIPSKHLVLYFQLSTCRVYAVFTSRHNGASASSEQLNKYENEKYENVVWEWERESSMRMSEQVRDWMCAWMHDKQRVQWRLGTCNIYSPERITSFSLSGQKSDFWCPNANSYWMSCNSVTAHQPSSESTPQTELLQGEVANAVLY